MIPSVKLLLSPCKERDTMFRFALVLTFFVMLLGICANPVNAGHKKKHGMPKGTLMGTITSVSADGTVMTVVGLAKKKKPARTANVRITKNTKIKFKEIDNKDEQ